LKTKKKEKKKAGAGEKMGFGEGGGVCIGWGKVTNFESHRGGRTDLVWGGDESWIRKKKKEQGGA